MAVDVTPDPFGGLTIPIEITATEILNKPYRSDEELRKALGDGNIVTVRGEVGKSSSTATNISLPVQ